MFMYCMLALIQWTVPALFWHHLGQKIYEGDELAMAGGQGDGLLAEGPVEPIRVKVATSWRTSVA